MQSPSPNTSGRHDGRSTKKVYLTTEDAISQGGAAIRLENLNDAKLITDEELNSVILKPLTALDDNEQRLDLLDDLREPYLFLSHQVLRVLLITPSTKTRVEMMHMLGCRLLDPKAEMEAFSALFRFAEDKLNVEGVLKARVQTLNATAFSKGGPVALLAGGRGRGRGAGMGLGMVQRGGGGRGRGGAGGRGVMVASAGASVAAKSEKIESAGSRDSEDGHLRQPEESPEEGAGPPEVPAAPVTTVATAATTVTATPPAAPAVPTPADAPRVAVVVGSAVGAVGLERSSSSTPITDSEASTPQAGTPPLSPTAPSSSPNRQAIDYMGTDPAPAAPALVAFLAPLALPAVAAPTADSTTTATTATTAPTPSAFVMTVRAPVKSKPTGRRSINLPTSNSGTNLSALNTKATTGTAPGSPGTLRRGSADNNSGNSLCSLSSAGSNGSGRVAGPVSSVAQRYLSNSSANSSVTNSRSSSIASSSSSVNSQSSGGSRSANRAAAVAALGGRDDVGVPRSPVRGDRAGGAGVDGVAGGVTGIAGEGGAAGVGVGGEAKRSSVKDLMAAFSHKKETPSPRSPRPQSQAMGQGVGKLRAQSLVNSRYAVGLATAATTGTGAGTGAGARASVGARSPLQIQLSPVAPPSPGGSVSANAEVGAGAVRVGKVGVPSPARVGGMGAVAVTSPVRAGVVRGNSIARRNSEWSNPSTSSPSSTKAVVGSDLASKCAAVLRMSRDEFLALEPEEAMSVARGSKGGSPDKDKSRASPSPSYYSYREVLRRNCSKQYGDMDSLRLEEALQEGEFFAVLGRSRGDFSKQPRWRQMEQKKKALLF